MDTTVPVLDWIDKEFLTQILQKEEGKKNIVVTSFQVSPAVPPGNNYGSTIVRVKVEYKWSKEDEELHSMSLIVKSEITEGLFKKKLDSIEPKEHVFYKRFLPEARKLTTIDFPPKMLFSPKSCAIVLEDLKERGFVMVDRAEQLDFDHSCLYLKAAAVFHAVSLALHKSHPELIESLGKESAENSQRKPLFKAMIKNGFKCLVDAMRRLDRFQKYAEIVEESAENILDMRKESQKAKFDEDSINTLTQGDPWIANMMFKYDDKGAVREMKLFDFQGLTITSPVNDLIVFIWTSVKDDVKLKRLTELYHVYLDSFNQKLEELNCPERFSFDKFMTNVRRLSPVIIHFLGFSSPFQFDPTPVDPKVFADTERNGYEKYYDYDDESSFCNVHLPKLLEVCELSGVFDYLEEYKNNSKKEDMETAVPVLDWLDKEYLTQILQKEEGKKNIVVTSFQVSPAVPPGNNYGSTIVRVKVEYKRSEEDEELHSMSLIVKSEITEGLFKKKLDSIEPKEHVFYKRFLPEARKLTTIDFPPKMLFSPKSCAIVLEDLKERGFVMVDRAEQLDFDHSCLYLKAAAVFHAVSLALHKSHPELIESLGKESAENSQLKPLFKAMIKNGFKCLVDAMRRLDRFQKYAEVVEESAENILDMCKESQKAKFDEDSINTLTQGDPWIANMMFKYDDKGAVREMKLFDFQGLTITSPVNDLIVFIWTSVKDDVKLKRLTELYHVYLDSFNQKLEELNCPERFSFDKFMTNVRRLSPVIIHFLGFSSPFQFDPTPVDPKVFADTERNAYEKYYDYDDESSFCNVHLPKLLEVCELSGVFDYLEEYKNNSKKEGMETPVPVLDWLDKEFLTQCLQKEEEKQDIVVTAFHVSPAVPAGNNYGSIIVRVKVDYKSSKEDEELHSISLIVKSELTDGPIKEMLDNVEPKEPVFYKRFLPEASKLTKIDFAPKMLFSPKSSVIVLEDLKEQGFAMADKTKQLDFEHCCLYLKAAASFHATSFAVHKTHPDFVESIGKENRPPDDSLVTVLFKGMAKNGFKCLADAARRLDRFRKYTDIIEDLAGKILDMYIEATSARFDEDSINTLTQGDPWIPNMMFKYDDNGAVSEVKLLDFQGLNLTSPVNDVMFFIWTSAHDDVKLNRLTELYHIYLDSFNQKLKELNCPERFSFDKFMTNVKRLSPLVIHLIGFAVPFIFDPNTVNLTTYADSENNAYEKYYDYDDENCFCNVHLPKLLEVAELTGVFDYLEEYKSNSRKV